MLNCIQLFDFAVRFILSLLFAFTFFSPLAQAKTVVEFYHGAECPHCHDQIKWMEQHNLSKKLEIQKYEVWHNSDNAKKQQAAIKRLGLPINVGNVPLTVVGDDYVIGFKPHKLQDLLGLPNESLADVSDWGSELLLQAKTWSWPLMALTLGLIDGFNPCAMWTLLILISFLLTLDRKWQRWLIGGIFVATSAIIYFLALLAYLLAFKQLNLWLTGPLMTIIFTIVAVIAILTGCNSLYLAYKNHTECDLRDGQAKQKFHWRLKEILGRGGLWLIILGVVALAISVNAVELLCSFAIPTTFTAILIQINLNFVWQLVALLLYIVTYILDDVVVLFIALWTLSLTNFSPKLTRYAHAIGGILLLILGGLLLWQPELLNSLL